MNLVFYKWILLIKKDGLLRIKTRRLLCIALHKEASIRQVHTLQLACHFQRKEVFALQSWEATYNRLSIEIDLHTVTIPRSLSGGRLKTRQSCLPPTSIKKAISFKVVISKTPVSLHKARRLILSNKNQLSVKGNRANRRKVARLIALSIELILPVAASGRFRGQVSAKNWK